MLVFPPFCAIVTSLYVVFCYVTIADAFVIVAFTFDCISHLMKAPVPKYCDGFY